MPQTRRVPLRRRLPMTLIKIAIARLIYRVLRLFFRSPRRIRRGGIAYEVDLSQVVDLSIFLVGSFQGYVKKNKFLKLAPDAIIFDIGANVGDMALSFAQLAPRGRVYAFEPSQFGWNKLGVNLALNPELADRVTPVRCLLSDSGADRYEPRVYASWSLERGPDHPDRPERPEERHPIHGGTAEPVTDAPLTCVDAFRAGENIPRVDLIKVDTDGHELPILKGAADTLKACRPYLIFEIGIYIMDERGDTFADYYDYLSGLGYKLFNLHGGGQVTMENYLTQIPYNFTTDLIAVPPTSTP